MALKETCLLAKSFSLLIIRKFSQTVTLLERKVKIAFLSIFS